MASHNIKIPAYLNPIPREPQATYLAREIAQLREALKQHPEDELYLTQRLLSYTSFFDPKEAIRLAGRMSIIDTKNMFTKETYLALGRSYAQENEIEKAIDNYRKGHEIDPSCEDCIIEWGGIHSVLGDFENAIKVYELLDNDNIKNGKENSYFQRAGAYFNLDQLDTALDYYKKALQLNPEDKDGFIAEDLAKTLVEMQSYDEAIPWFKKALEKKAEKADSHYGIGVCYQALEDYYRALHHYTETLKLKPDYLFALNNIAYIFINNEGKPKEGIEMLEKALETADDKIALNYMYNNLRSAYGAKGDYDKARYYKSLYIKNNGLDEEYIGEEEYDEDDEDYEDYEDDEME